MSSYMLLLTDWNAIIGCPERHLLANTIAGLQMHVSFSSPAVGCMAVFQTLSQVFVGIWHCIRCLFSSAALDTALLPVHAAHVPAHVPVTHEGVQI